MSEITGRLRRHYTYLIKSGYGNETSEPRAISFTSDAEFRQALLIHVRDELGLAMNRRSFLESIPPGEFIPTYARIQLIEEEIRFKMVLWRQGAYARILQLFGGHSNDEIANLTTPALRMRAAKAIDIPNTFDEIADHVWMTPSDGDSDATTRASER